MPSRRFFKSHFSPERPRGGGEGLDGTPPPPGVEGGGEGETFRFGATAPFPGHPFPPRQKVKWKSAAKGRGPGSKVAVLHRHGPRHLQTIALSPQARYSSDSFSRIIPIKSVGFKLTNTCPEGNGAPLGTTLRMAYTYCLGNSPGLHFYPPGGEAGLSFLSFPRKNTFSRSKQVIPPQKLTHAPNKLSGLSSRG